MSARRCQNLNRSYYVVIYFQFVCARSCTVLLNRFASCSLFTTYDSPRPFYSFCFHCYLNKHTVRALLLTSGPATRQAFIITYCEGELTPFHIIIVIEHLCVYFPALPSLSGSFLVAFELFTPAKHAVGQSSNP